MDESELGTSKWQSGNIEETQPAPERAEVQVENVPGWQQNKPEVRV